MEAYQNTGKWLPVMISDTDDINVGIAGVPYDAPGLSVTYQKQGGSVETLTLTAENWAESQKGVYRVYFPAEAFSTLGLFLYFLEYTGAVGYKGAYEVVAEPISRIVGALAAQLGAKRITVVSNIQASNGAVIVKRGIDYLADTVALSWTIEGAPDLTGAEAVFISTALESDRAVSIVPIDQTTYTLILELDSAVTAAMINGIHGFSILFTRNGLKLPYLVEGDINVTDLRGKRVEL